MTTDRPLPDGWNGEGWIDVSRPLSPRTSVWPGDRGLELNQVSIGGLLVSALATTCHVGTHVDAPLHLDSAGIAVDKIPLDRLIGPAEVMRLPVGCGSAGCDGLPRGWIPRYSKVLFRSDSQPVDSPIGEGFSAISADLVHWLNDHGVSMVGIDTPSVDVFSSTELEAHHALLERGMTWIEGLYLKGVQPGCYMLMALPMPLSGTEAAPVRAVIKKLPEDRR